MKILNRLLKFIGGEPDRPDCPECGAEALVVVYGMANPRDYDQSHFFLAGCIIPADPPAYRCSACDNEWGLKTFTE